MTTRSRRSLIQLVSVVASFTSLDITSAEVAPWRMKDGKVMDLELRDAWGEDDAAMVEFLTRGMKIVTLKRNELHPEDQKKIPAPQPGHEDFRFAWATARPAAGENGEVTITYKFARTLPGVIGCDEGTLKVAPFKIGNVGSGTVSIGRIRPWPGNHQT